MAKITTTLFGELAIFPREVEAPVVETLSFLTDVMESFNGSEQRLQLRSKPRQTFEYSMPLQAWHMANAFNTEYGALRKRWAVPVWTEAQNVGFVIENATTIGCNTSLYDLRPNSLAMLYNNFDNWQVVEIATVGADHIILINGAKAQADSFLIPVRLGYVSSNIERITNGHNGKTKVVFEIEDNLELTTATPSQYLSEDIYYDASLLSGSSISRSVEKRLDINDFDLGPVERRSPWKNSRFGTPYNKLINNAAEMRQFKDFLHRRAGKFRAFWLPTFEVNMRVKNTGVIASTLVIESDSFIDYASIRKNIAIQTTSGAWYNRVISNPVQINSNSVQLTLSSALNINAKDIARVSYLGLNRLDADRIEISWNGAGIAEANFRILELNP